jgi:predicted transcriptional regulator
MRAAGVSWRTISDKLGVGVGTPYKAVGNVEKTDL